MESVKKILREDVNIRKLKSVNANGFNIWAELEGDTMWVMWNYKEGKPYTQRSEWLSHVKGPLFSTYTNWDELDFALASLGVKKVSEKSHIEDWGNDDKDTFVKSVYDFSPILKQK